MTPSRDVTWFRRKVRELGHALAALPPSRRALALAKLEPPAQADADTQSARYPQRANAPSNGRYNDGR